MKDRQSRMKGLEEYKIRNYIVKRTGKQDYSFRGVYDKKS